MDTPAIVAKRKTLGPFDRAGASASNGLIGGLERTADVWAESASQSREIDQKDARARFTPMSGRLSLRMDSGYEECNMNHLEAVDATLERARGQSRRLKDDARDFCRERSRLILPEGCGARRWWVYRGGGSVLPLGWSIRVGEFAYNLRSALDQLVWQLAAAHGNCAGEHGAGECPSRYSEFPIRVRWDPGRLDLRLCGVGPAARAYIESVQPSRRRSGRLSASRGNRVGGGLGLLRDICNRDKHQTLLRTSARWTGQWPRAPGPGEHVDPGPGCGRGMQAVGCELRYGQALLVTSGWADGHWLEFPLDAYFDDMPHSRSGGRRGAPVAETLDACLDSVEMVVSRLRQEL